MKRCEGFLVGLLWYIIAGIVFMRPWFGLCSKAKRRSNLGNFMPYIYLKVVNFDFDRPNDLENYDVYVLDMEGRSHAHLELVHIIQ